MSWVVAGGLSHSSEANSCGGPLQQGARLQGGSREAGVPQEGPGNEEKPKEGQKTIVAFVVLRLLTGKTLRESAL